MTLSSKSIDLLKNRSEFDLWNYVGALQHMQNAIFQLEKDEEDPDVLKELATRALEIGKELEEIISLLEEKIDE